MAGSLVGAREDRNEPTSTAGMLPMTIESVTPNWTWPKAKPHGGPPRQRHCLGQIGAHQPPGPDIGYRNSNSTIISEPEPTDVSPTIMPPMMPITTVGPGRIIRSLRVASRSSRRAGQARSA